MFGLYKWSTWKRRWRFGTLAKVVVLVCCTTYFIVSHMLPTVSQVDKVALCLVGGARAFELTGLSIKENLLDAYPNSDVFLNVPADDNTHKLTILSRLPRIASLVVFPQVPMREDASTAQLLKAKGSPNGVQGLLQYFDLVEGCTRLIEEHERRRGIKYKWVFRTRVDGFWTSRSPPLRSLDPHAYTLPNGTDSGGLNDRLGVGTRDLSFRALSRLSVLPALKDLGYSNLNSEASFREHLWTYNISVGRAEFPFCILSHRQYHFPDGPVPVISIDSRGAFNGAKCRPCHPAATGAEAQRQLALVAEFHGTIGDGTGVNLCNAQGPWEVNWDTLFDAIAGPKAAATRKWIVSRSFKECVAENVALQASVASYTGPPPVVLCQLSRWGEVQSVGEPGDEWPLYLKGLHPQSVVYSICARCSLSWELALTVARGLHHVHAFNSLPLELPGATEKEVKRMRARIVVHDWCIGSADGGHCTDAVSEQQEPTGGAAAENQEEKAPARVPRRQLSASLSELGHEKIDVLKLDMGTMTLELVMQWDMENVDLPVCQLLLRFGKEWAASVAEGSKARVVAGLNRLGLSQIKCVGTSSDERCIFVSSKHCVVGH